jgi:hypothetical protein
MLTHIVVFKYKADVPDSVRADHRRQLASLRTIKGVIDLKVGADVVRSARAFDTALVVTFEDRAGLDAYAADPEHMPVSQFGVSLCEQIASVDFE